MDRNSKIINFVHNQTGPKLMFVNADRDGMTDDTIDSIKQYWEEEVGYADSEDDDYYESAINWNTYTIVDKGYGYFRDWMDQGIDEHVIIRVIRLMYQQQVSDSRMLFGGEDSDEYTTELEKILDGNDLDFCANTGRVLKIEVAMKNNFGFGGTNGTLVFKKFNA